MDMVLAELGGAGFLNLPQGGGGGSTEIIAEEYDATATYAVGDYCTHEKKLYVCNTTISTAEPWTAAHWTEVTVGSELEQLKENKADKDMGITGASVGQFIRVKTVDANGRPTSYETVTLSNAETEEY